MEYIATCGRCKERKNIWILFTWVDSNTIQNQFCYECKWKIEDCYENVWIGEKVEREDVLIIATNLCYLSEDFTIEKLLEKLLIVSKEGKEIRNIFLSDENFTQQQYYRLIRGEYPQFVRLTQ